jgi:hypothetical protein
MLIWAEIVWHGMSKLLRLSSLFLRASTAPLIQRIYRPASLLRYTWKGNALRPCEPPWAVTKDSATVRLYKWHRSRNLSLGSSWFRGHTMIMVGLQDTESSVRIAISSNSCRMLELPFHFDGMRADYCSTVDPFMDCIYWDSPSVALLEGLLNHI